MMRWRFGPLALFGPCALVTLSLSAQDSLSASAAHDLSELLTARKLDAVATRDPEESDRFIAALFFPKSQFLVITARYTVPSLLEEKLAKRQYRDIYGDLHGGSLQESKVFFQDLGADGLHAQGDHAVDVLYERGIAQTIFDGRKDGQTGKSYAEQFGKADALYSRLLSLLIEELKGPADSATSLGVSTDRGGYLDS
jgi:hypothetical protein